MPINYVLGDIITRYIYNKYTLYSIKEHAISAHAEWRSGGCWGQISLSVLCNRSAVCR